MAERLLLDPALAPALEAAGLGTADDLFRLGGARDGASVVREVEHPVRGTRGRFVVKHYHYGGWRRARGLLGRGTLWGTAPEIREFQALRWLRDHDLPAPRPVAAASRTSRGRLVDHALLTELVPDTDTLAQVVAEGASGPWADPQWRARAVGGLVGDLRRMARLGFVHRDAHARNVLLRRGDAERHWWIDCRRGGPATVRHRPTYDLAALLLDLEASVGPDELHGWITAWAGEDGVDRVLPAFERDRARHRRRRHRRRR